MEIGKAVGETAIDLIKNETVLEKASGIMGMLFPYAGLEKKALDMYISDIENSDMPSESKMIALLNAKPTIKKLKNQKKIAEIAIANAKEDTDFTSQSGVNEEWLERFMDSAGLVSSEDIQLVWGKILSGEFENPGSTPPSMIRILSEITPTYARAFKKLCSMQTQIVVIDDEGHIEKSSQIIIVPYKGNKDWISEIGLSLSIIDELSTLGLIKFDYANGYVRRGVSSQRVLCFTDEKTEMITKHKANEIPSGNVVLTEAGKCLQKITPTEKLDGYEDRVKEYMKRREVSFMKNPTYQVIKKDGKIQVINSK